MQIKACNLTENEIKHLIAWLGSGLYTHEEPDTKIERINYLHKRLKAFKEVELVLKSRKYGELNYQKILL